MTFIYKSESFIKKMTNYAKKIVKIPDSENLHIVKF